MEVKCLEIRDEGTFIPVICLRPVPENEGQRYLLRRDGYRGDDRERETSSKKKSERETCPL